MLYNHSVHCIKYIFLILLVIPADIYWSELSKYGRYENTGAKCWLVVYQLSLDISFRIHTFFLKNFFKDYIFILLLIMTIYVCLCPWDICLRRTEESIGSPGARVTGGCELPAVSSGNQTKVLWKSRKCSQLLSHLCSLSKYFLLCLTQTLIYSYFVFIYSFWFIEMVSLISSGWP